MSKAILYDEIYSEYRDYDADTSITREFVSKEGQTLNIRTKDYPYNSIIVNGSVYFIKHDCEKIQND